MLTRKIRKSPQAQRLRASAETEADVQPSESTSTLTETRIPCSALNFDKEKMQHCVASTVFDRWSCINRTL